MPDFVGVIEKDLELIRARNLFRDPPVFESAQGPEMRIGNKDFVNFSSNDYLGLATHPALREAAIRAIPDFGVGAGSSRLISGTLRPHRELEESLANFKGTESALCFSSGHAAATGAICALLGRGDVILIDKLVHASVIDAARLSGAILRVYRHNDLADLEKKLQWAVSRHPQSRRLVVTESVFSMDGDLAPLLNIVELKERHGAWLMVDEAHATGLFGENCSGLVSEFGLVDRVDLQLVTLGKALGTAGGAICGPLPLIELLINRARTFIYSTAPSPAAAAATRAALELISSALGGQLRHRLWMMLDHLKSTLISSGYAPGVVRAPIVPLILGEETIAGDKAGELRDRGVFVPAIRYPTVARGSARLRFTITASHSLAHLERLRRALEPEEPVS